MLQHFKNNIINKIKITTMNKYQCQVEVEATSQIDAENKINSINNLLNEVEHFTKMNISTLNKESITNIVDKLIDFKKHNTPLVEGIVHLGNVLTTQLLIKAQGIMEKTLEKKQ